MNKREHDQIVSNKNKLISTNGFISTTLAREVALDFALRAAQHSELVPILFEITASPDLKRTTFADISAFSAFPDEKEVLFNLGSAFKITDIEEHSGFNSYTVVRMLATDEGYASVEQYMELSKNDLEGDDKKVMFGRLLIDMGQYKESKDYFDECIEYMKNTGRDDALECASFYHNQGRAHACMGEFDQAVTLTKRALEIRQKHLNLDDPLCAHTLNSVGVMEGEMGRYTDAKGKFKEAFDAFEKQSTSGSKDIANLQIAVTNSNIGWVDYLQGNYNESEEHQKEALKIRERLLVKEHPLIADNLNALGALHHARGEYQKATKSYNDALAIRHKTLPSHHPAIANSYQALGSVELENGNYEQALTYYKKALNIFVEALGTAHLLVASSYKAIGSVYLEKGDYKTAHECFTRALNISIKSLSPQHPVAGECYHCIGMIHERQGSYDEAIKQYTIALHCIQTPLPIEHPSIAKVLSSFANTYILMKDLHQAEVFLTRAHDIQKKIYIHHHPDLVLTLNNLGVIYTYKDDQVKAKQYFEDALSMCKQCFPTDHPAKARTLFNIGEMYARATDYSNAHENYLNALALREKVLPSKDLSLADIHSQIAYVCLMQKMYVEAYQHWAKSRSIYSNNNYLENHPDLKRVNDNLTILDRVMKKHHHKLPPI
ncbi:unnamed protein product [Adineta steineri]|nr:unnamed protein product [Adineta steineri]